MAASGTRQRVDVFYDVGSPYSWLALETLWAYRGAWALDLRLRPALLGGVFKACGNMPPALAAPFKAPQMMKDMSRAAAQWWGARARCRRGWVCCVGASRRWRARRPRRGGGAAGFLDLGH